LEEHVLHLPREFDSPRNLKPAVLAFAEAGNAIPPVIEPKGLYTPGGDGRMREYFIHAYAEWTSKRCGFTLSEQLPRCWKQIEPVLAL